eukprot:m.160852 g.160852  ORF g.160852 m.160852 type:complete len:409 (-) comp15176_c0_seq3:582-1808(-)
MRVYTQTVFLALGLIFLAGWLGSNGIIPFTPASEWRREILHSAETTPLHTTRESKTEVATPEENFLGATECGSPTLVIGVLTSAKDHRSPKLRQTLRNTWFKLVSEDRVTIRFLLSLKPGENIPESIQQENEEFNDILLLPIDPGSRKGYSGSGPSNILERVRAFFRWTKASCGSYRYVLKTDDDCYVAARTLLKRIDENDFPTERLYMGRFLGGMPAKNHEGKPDEDNYQRLSEFPAYAGAGYLITPDVVSFLGDPGLPMLYHRVEDRGIGVMLYGFNVTYLKGEKEFQPWGNCFPESLWIHHYSKEIGLMERRYQRDSSGQNICGEGFKANEICTMADQGKAIKLKCPRSLKITKVELDSKKQSILIAVPCQYTGYACFVWSSNYRGSLRRGTFWHCSWERVNATP